MESDIKQDELLEPLEKHASFKTAFDFRAKINAQQRAQRAVMVPLFTILDKSVKTKLLVDAILGECGAEIVDYMEPSANSI